ncbi:unnamed protein product [Diabrotica balteata]|uniref:Glucose-methanol-choline oxidoreductase N-terminal domain-containing protein n=1 Tax=Diabrotica balteata TaxID=107213 RepID=A0A9P0H022_DIABA|nr:unnamed protein product [Diabrotica balteata]
MKQKAALILALLFVFWTPAAEAQLYVFVGKLIDFLLDASSIQTVLFPFYPDRQLSITFQNTFDFIIVGSGPSGSALASRLTENPNVNVLLLENGEQASILTEIPIIAGAFGSTIYQWGYTTEPQPGFCRGCTNHQIKWEHGNAVGGSTIINYMIYVRGNRRDYDIWADLGNPGWGYDDLLPLFKKIEDVHVAIKDADYRGTGGPVTVTDVAWRTKVSGHYVEAAQQAGYSYVDYNGKEQLGVSYVQATTRDGRRDSAERAYLRPIRNRKNLKIQIKSKVTKVLIKDNAAYGVEYSHNGIKHTVYASKEVILSAGALNSPQLLMLSGIGPREDLEALGIEVIKDLPVGKKMYDHATFPGLVYTLNTSVSINTIGEILNLANYPGFLLGRGFFTSIGGVEAINYVHTNVTAGSDPLYPDIELLIIGGSLANDYGVVFRNMFNIPPKIYDAVFKPLENKYTYQCTPVLLHPKSYGSIKLRSNNPFDAPKFYANYFSDPENEDIRRFIVGIREFQRINSYPALQKVGAKLVETPVPGCEKETFNTDKYWECALRTVIASYYHMVATCKMGPETDREAVVDSQLRVYGVKKLRVVDTSVIPIPPSTHNMAPGYVIGEKGAVILKNFYNI